MGVISSRFSFSVVGASEKTDKKNPKGERGVTRSENVNVFFCIEESSRNFRVFVLRLSHIATRERDIEREDREGREEREKRERRERKRPTPIHTREDGRAKKTEKRNKQSGENFSKFLLFIYASGECKINIHTQRGVSLSRCRALSLFCLPLSEERKRAILRALFAIVRSRRAFRVRVSGFFFLVRSRGARFFFSVSFPCTKRKRRRSFLRRILPFWFAAKIGSGFALPARLFLCGNR